MINDDSHMTRDEMYDTAMGYGLITPSPDTEDRSLAQISSPNTVDISVCYHNSIHHNFNILFSIYRMLEVLLIIKSVSMTIGHTH